MRAAFIKIVRCDNLEINILSRVNILYLSTSYVQKFGYALKPSLH